MRYCLIQYIYLIQIFQIANMTRTTNNVNNKLQFPGCDKCFNNKVKLLTVKILKNNFRVNCTTK